MIFASIVLLAITHKCYALSYDDIESVDDIYRYYYDGQIDRAQFEYLLELFDFGRLTYEDIQSIGIVEPVELIGKYDSLSQNGLVRHNGKSGTNKIGLREYFEADGDVSGNYYYNFNLAHADLRLKIRSKGGKYFIDNRSIHFIRDSVHLELGNYLVSEGYGLTIGRFDYQPSTGYDRTYDFDFWSPINSSYNGIKSEFVSGGFSGRFYLSSKYYNETKKRFAGGGLSYRGNRLILGISSGYNSLDINRSEDIRLAEGLYFSVSDSNYLIGGEIARVKQSAAYYLTAAKVNEYGTIIADFWSYARHFNSFNSSGKAASDYHSFYPTDEPVGFRTSQSGETGFAARFAKDYLAFGLQGWKQADHPDLSLLASTKFRLILPDLAAIGNQFNYSVKRDKGAFWWKGVVSELPISYLRRFGLKVESRDPNINNADSYGFLTFGSDFDEDLSVWADIRGYFDGAWRTIITEKAFLTGGFYLDVELVIGDNWRASAIFEKAL